MTPDFIVVPGFIDLVEADRINFAEGNDFFDFEGLPLDGVSALGLGGPEDPSPTNFAGEVPEPAAALGHAAAMLCIGVLARRRRTLAR